MEDRNLDMTEAEKSSLIALFRAEIRFSRGLDLIRHEIGLYCHSRGFKIEELEECERIAQDEELD